MILPGTYTGIMEEIPFFFKFNLKFSTHERQCMNGSSTVVKLPTARNCHPFVLFCLFSLKARATLHPVHSLNRGINSTFYWTKEERATRKSQCEWHRNNRYRRGRFCGQGDETRRPRDDDLLEKPQNTIRDYLRTDPDHNVIITLQHVAQFTHVLKGAGKFVVSGLNFPSILHQNFK